MSDAPKAGILPSFTSLPQTALRFPLALACAVAVAAIRIAATHGFRPDGFTEIEWEIFAWRAQSLLIGAYFLFITVHLLLHFRRRLAGVILAALGCGLLIYIQWWGQHGAGLAVPGLLLLAMAAPFLPRQVENETIWNFNHHSWLGGGFSLLVGILTGVVISILLQAVEYLFQADIPYQAYNDVWAVSLCAVAGWFALGFFPVSQAAIERIYPGRGVIIVATYILVPFVIVYTALVYAYAVKILIAWELPKGRIVYTMGLYTAAGIITFLIAYPIRQSGKRWVRWFCRGFFPVLLLPAILMALAVAIRLNANGVTETRYATALLAGWSILVALLYTLRPALNIRWLPVALAIPLLLVSFGPWGATSFSVRSQMPRLEARLTQLGVLANGKVQKAPQPIEYGDLYALQDDLRYLLQRGQRESIKAWFRDTDIAFTPDDIHLMMRSLGLQKPPAVIRPPAATQ